MRPSQPVPRGSLCGNCDQWAQLKATSYGLCDNPQSRHYHARQPVAGGAPPLVYDLGCCDLFTPVPEAAGHDKRSRPVGA